ncbi:Unknown protein sequence [Pseudomonas amygdali pv. lachrymans]|uniref:Uncharacterized protein n=1 Tax=Pseudomonas amygdali pv. lachrymans TaxID=53707 RepID=A0ABR5KSR1_PSEAV|nr:Unknown protein sequence [Pseudomonas amygdali pv. lachrymans]
MSGITPKPASTIIDGRSDVFAILLSEKGMKDVECFGANFDIHGSNPGLEV